MKLCKSVGAVAVCAVSNQDSKSIPIMNNILVVRSGSCMINAS